MEIPIVFTYTSNVPLILAERLVASIKKVMPGSHIYQQTDARTDEIPGCKAVRRTKGEDFAEFFLGHLAECQLDRFIKLDYDCIVQKDLRPVFKEEFQVGLTVRDEDDKSLSDFFSKRHPHNAGVMFSKGKHSFWVELYQEYMNIIDRDGWMDACDAMETAVAKTKVKLKDFPCRIYNYTPVMPDDPANHAAVVHYKGNRKHWGLDTGDMYKALLAGNQVADKVEDWLKKRTEWDGR